MMLIRKPAVALVLAAMVAPAAGFNLGAARWVDNATTFNIALPDGVDPRFEAALADAARAWNEKTAFRFNVNRELADPCFLPTDGNYRNGVAFADEQCGGAEFSPGTLAITLNWSIDGKLAQSGIVFNSKHHLWDVYEGPWQRSVADFGRVAVHELGHAAGLRHESHNPAIMAPMVGEIRAPLADDAAGIEALYEIPPLLSTGFEPADTAKSNIDGVSDPDAFRVLHADVDGDGLEDRLAYRPIDGLWEIVFAGSADAPARLRLGGPGRQPLVGDFDGDGRADISTWVASSGSWQVWIFGAPAAERIEVYVAGDAYARDMDGDGRAELVVSNGSASRAFDWETLTARR